MQWFKMLALVLEHEKSIKIMVDVIGWLPFLHICKIAPILYEIEQLKLIRWIGLLGNIYLHNIVVTVVISSKLISGHFCFCFKGLGEMQRPAFELRILPIMQRKYQLFAHENQVCLHQSQTWEVCHCTKSGLLRCLQLATSNQVVPGCDQVVDAEVLDGAAIVHILPLKGVRTNFNDCAVGVFMHYIRRRLQNVNMLDIMWDHYIKNIIKLNTRESRITGQHRWVMATTPLPRNWQSFLQVDSNKEAGAVQLPGRSHRKGNITFDTSVKFTRVHKDTTRLEPCTHEEADTRIMLHVA